MRDEEAQPCFGELEREDVPVARRRASGGLAYHSGEAVVAEDGSDPEP